MAKGKYPWFQQPNAYDCCALDDKQSLLNTTYTAYSFTASLAERAIYAVYIDSKQTDQHLSIFTIHYMRFFLVFLYIQIAIYLCTRLISRSNCKQANLLSKTIYVTITLRKTSWKYTKMKHVVSFVTLQRARMRQKPHTNVNVNE